MNLRSWFWGGGRIGRQAYWLALAAYFAAGWLAEAVVRTLGAAGEPMLGYAVAGYLVAAGISLWVSACLITRRLHDIGRSGWWQLVPLAIMIAGLAAAEPIWATKYGISEAGSALGLIVALAAYLGFLAVLGAVPSTGPNRFDSPATATD